MSAPGNSRRRIVLWALAIVVVLTAAVGGGLYGYQWWHDQPVNPVTADGGDQVMVMDFSQTVQIEPPAPGWRHRKFWTRPPMTISQTVKDDVAAARFETDASGSIFGRFTDIDLGEYPSLRWTWLVEKPIESDLDERTAGGDDHPARLFIAFDDTDGGRHFMEIIWSNKAFKPGEYKYIGDFPHYVANGGNDNVGRWIEEEVNLLGIYRETTKRSDTPRVRLIAVFCDSDDTKTSSIAYFGKVWLVKTAVSQ
jgi:hypothetical protein